MNTSDSFCLLRWEDDNTQSYGKAHPYKIIKCNTTVSNYSTVAFDVSSASQAAGSRVVSPEDVGTEVLRYLLKVTASFLGHGQVNKAVIAVPAKFTPQQRAATGAAYKAAGLKVTPIHMQLFIIAIVIINITSSACFITPSSRAYRIVLCIHLIYSEYGNAACAWYTLLSTMYIHIHNTGGACHRGADCSRRCLSAAQEEQHPSHSGIRLWGWYSGRVVAVCGQGISAGARSYPLTLHVQYNVISCRMM
jgi:hypothetical protein